MTDFPGRPFLTERFKTRGGGIDYLGLRQVNLSMLENDLIPGINNATWDLGYFCLGAWMPWKFRQLCGKDGKAFLLSRYTAFREALEVAIAYATRHNSPGNQHFGRPRNRIGVRQRFRPPGRMSFALAERSESTSLYAAPQYGPSLAYTRLLAGTAMAEDGSSTGIPLTAEDPCTEQVVRAVERSLSSSSHFARVVQLQVPAVDEAALDDLALHGLHPSFYRELDAKAKRAFIQQFFFGDGQEVMAARRRLTARLICETVRRAKFTDTASLRACWHTNLLPGGQPLILKDKALLEHRARWAVFQARQIQRSILEGFLRSFEMAVAAGCCDIDEILSYWENRSPKEFRSALSAKWESFLRAQAVPISRASDLLTVSKAWNAKVHGAHEFYEDQEPATDDDEVLTNLTTLARWWHRLRLWLHEGMQEPLLAAGRGSERISIRWFADWLERRLTVPVSSVLRDIYSELVFAQHVKFALIRFDGAIQRLRFTLGDEGIVPTSEARDKLGKVPYRTADRLDAFVGILSDLDIIQYSDDMPFAVAVHHQLLTDGTYSPMSITKN
jgi:hypothetical protein